MSEVLTTLGFRDFTIQLNHRQLLSAMLEAADVPMERRADVLVAIDKLDKIGPARVAEEFHSQGVSVQATSACLAALESVPAFDDLIAGHDSGVTARAEVAQILSLVSNTAAAGHVSFVPRLARGLSYYTGAIMEIAVPDLAGSLGGGGRYDGLIGMFLGRNVPACGFSLGLERVIVVMTERQMFPESVAGGAVDVMVSLWNDEARGDALALAGELRGGGLQVDVYPESDKLGKQFKYASSRNVPFVTIVGDDERANGMVGVKDLRSGAQDTMPRADAAAFIRRILDPVER